MTAQSLARSRLFSSRSTAARMNSARLFGPSKRSIRASVSSDSRTSVGRTASDGRPMRLGVAEGEAAVKSETNPTSLIDDVTDISYTLMIAARQWSFT